MLHCSAVFSVSAARSDMIRKVGVLNSGLLMKLIKVLLQLTNIWSVLLLIVKMISIFH
jgi:hypothetical protein